ncbi:MAG: mannose-1-phosphate guanylyltransferase/mannose-6-phosphate isomerase [Gammaproteobacteria bacterium]
MATCWKVLPVILAGGSGTRLWPLSRENYPKQFLTLMGDQSLFQQTLSRVSEPTYLPPLIITSEAHRFLVAEQIRQWGGTTSALMLEPARKGTAPAAALAAHYALQRYGKDTLLLILPADHYLSDNGSFHQVVEQAKSIAGQGYLTTFGIKPTRAETGFGYIQPGTALDAGFAASVQAFIEKPPFDQAEAFYRSGQYYWNSGMFLFQSALYLSELASLDSDMAKQSECVWETLRSDEDFIRFDEKSFSELVENSIDYALMEKTQLSAVIPLETAWHDLGSWQALSQIKSLDGAGNACIGDVIAFQSEGCYLQSSQRLVAAIGVKNLVVVETPDALLVMDKHHSQSLKEVVTLLKESGREEAIHHRTVHRPWGCFESVMSGDRFQVKRISVAVGARLSLQLHHHRSEHWVVVKGTARVTRGEEVFLLSENQSTYIPIGTTHRLENVGKIPLEMIEVQSGGYLGEDDIVRLEDAYGRATPLPVEVETS